MDRVSLTSFLQRNELHIGKDNQMSNAAMYWIILFGTIKIWPLKKHVDHRHLGSLGTASASETAILAADNSYASRKQPDNTMLIDGICFSL